MQEKEPRIIIVSNRLPIKLAIKNDVLAWRQSEGGLATGLSSIYKEGNNLWIGWSGVEDSISKKYHKEINDGLAKRNLLAVDLTDKEIEEYYEGFSNETLWPICHYFPSYAKYNAQNWQTYITVNEKFAQKIAENAGEHDIIWVQDYQLMLVPAMVRKLLPNATIGYFHHIPFPGYEIFREIPWRNELLKGLLGADLIGFQTFSDVSYFIKNASLLTHVNSESNRLFYQGRMIQVDAFPISIDYQKFSALPSLPITQAEIKKIENMVEDKKLIISIDRLDYSKGLDNRLEAIKYFFNKYPEYKQKIIFFQLVVPSRDKVDQYAKLKHDIDGMVGSFNAAIGNLTWQPVTYMYRSLPINLLAALYASADIALVTPIRDGMNLVAKEFIAVKGNAKKAGVLILSEKAGAAKELYEALRINPHDHDMIASAIKEALDMEEAEKQRRIHVMCENIKKFDIHKWVQNFMQSLEELKQGQALMKTKYITDEIEAQIDHRYKTSQHRVIFLDYDGTLVQFSKKPELAIPDDEVIRLVQKLSDNPKNYVVIISGRDKTFMDHWFGTMHVHLVAEHGVWHKKMNSVWKTPPTLNNQWIPEAETILQRFVERTPGTFIEKKSYSLAWHYRNADNILAEQRIIDIESSLSSLFSDYGLQILKGNSVIEIKSIHVNKGTAAKHLLSRISSDFILALGDDVTDEYTFKSLPEDAITIKVGTSLSAATYRLNSVTAVRTFLSKLSEID